MSLTTPVSRRKSAVDDTVDITDSQSQPQARTNRNPLCSLLPFTIPAPTLHRNATPEEHRTRKAELAANQQLYVYESPETIPGIAFIKGPVDNLPNEMPSRLWFLKTSIAGIKVILNFVNFNPLMLLSALYLFIRSIFTNTGSTAAMDKLVKDFRAHVPSSEVAKHIENKFHKANIQGSLFEEKSKVLEPYREMWRIIDRPHVSNNFLQDDVFARMRVAGFNPMALFGVSSLEKMPFELQDVHLPQHKFGDSVQKAISEQRVYAVDYSELGVIKPDANPAKVIAVTKGVFVIPPNTGGALQPVAIEVNGELVLPSTEPGCTRWAAAKMALTNDDAVHHELVAHLGRTHLLVEPFVAATMRQLPSSHPLHMLLRPHFEGTVFINDTASSNLVAKGGEVDRIFAGDITSVMEWTAERVLKTQFNHVMPDVELKARGLTNPILEMPYREDALEHFDALQNWVRDYLSCFYSSDADVKKDPELKAWVEELVDPVRGRVQDFGDGGRGKVETLDYLVRAVAFVIFSASVQHAAVNFPQFSFMSYAPAAPGSLWRAPPRAHEEADLQHWAQMLTPTEIAVEQVQILGVIGTIYHTRLGGYGLKLPWRRDVAMGLISYWRALAKIDNRIKQREKGSGSLKYDFLRPQNIPQSINI